VFPLLLFTLLFFYVSIRLRRTSCVSAFDL
jgi:hypothetical protein